MYNHQPFGPYEKYFKRPVDFICGMAAAVVFCWLYVILIILGTVFMKGNPFYTQERPGKDEKIFKLIKFRTMDNRKDGEGNLLPDEIRLNTYGRFLRKTSLDELPEAFNIIKGDMSIIGPRPALWNQDDLIAERDKYGANDVKPGLTGWAQINGRDELPIDVKARLDGEYVSRMGFIFDLKCFFGTIISVLKSDGVVEGGTGAIEEKEYVNK